MIARNLIIDYALAKAQGVSQPEAIKLALVASPFRPAFGMLVAFALAREEAPKPPPVATTTFYTPKGLGSLFRRRNSARTLAMPSAAPAPQSAQAAAPGAGSASSGSSGLQRIEQTVATAGLPSFYGLDKTQADQWAHIFNLTPVYEGPSTTGKVESQDPGPGKPPKDNVLKLKFK